MWGPLPENYNSSMNVYTTVLASTVSALIVLVVKSFLDNAREDRNRFHAERRAAYARFLVLARDVYLSTRTYAAATYDETVQNFPLLKEGYEDSPVTITPELREAYEVIQILATPAVREAAQRVNSCLPRIIDVVFSRGDCFSELRKLDSELTAATDEFRLAARQELGIKDS